MTKKFKISSELIDFATTYSPYLRRLIENFFYIVEDVNKFGLEASFEKIINKVEELNTGKISKEKLMSE